MSLEIKQVEKEDGKTIISVQTPGTIFQLFKHVKKTARDFRIFQYHLTNKDTPREMKEYYRQKWARRAKSIVMLEE